MNCSHVWIDQTDPPISRMPYSPVIGRGRREMKRGATYQCQRCGGTLMVPMCVLGRAPASLVAKLLGRADRKRGGG